MTVSQKTLRKGGVLGRSIAIFGKKEEFLVGRSLVGVRLVVRDGRSRGFFGLVGEMDL